MKVNGMSKAEEKKLLITGAAGFIGSNFVFYFLKAHPEYKIVWRRCADVCGQPGKFKARKGKIGFYQVDISKERRSEPDV
jgi:dTDP-glucose 4,6-dehydratase